MGIGLNRLPALVYLMVLTYLQIKFKYGNSSGLGGYDVNVPGVPDDVEKKVDDNFHSIEE